MSSRMIAGFFTICCLGLFPCPSAGSADREQELLERLILDAQTENQGKVSGGVMSYRITSKSRLEGKKEPYVVDATVRWDRRKAFWTFKVSDPSSVLTDGLHLDPVQECRTEYALRTGDKVYLYNAYLNTLHEIVADKLRYMTDNQILDVFPETLGSRCCFPSQTTGRPWSEMTGSNYARLFANSTLKLERVSKSVIRQTLTDPTGTIATTDFSLEFSGYPIRMDFQDGTSSSQNVISTFEWMNSGGATVLKKFRIVRGDISRGEANARECHEFEARSFKSSKSELTFDFNALKALLPKNTKVVDHLRQKSYQIDPKVPRDAGLTDDVLEKLGRDVKKEGFVKP